VLRTRIVGTGAYAPEKVLTNVDLESMVETSDAWIRERTGIVERRIAAPEQASSDLATAAAERALENAGITADQIDLIIVATVTPDAPLPSCAAYVQAKLGARNAFAFDLVAACAGSLYGLSVADQFIQTGKVKHALVIGVELLSRIVDWSDRNTCVLFGDAAGAMVLAPGNEGERGVLSTHLYLDGQAAGILHIPGGGSRMPASAEVLEQKLNKVHMNGREVYRFAVRALQDSVRTALEANGLTAADVDHVVAHQANLRIIEAVLSRLDIPLERCHLNLDRYGNTSSASVPMTLDEANRAGSLKPGDVIAMMAIGAGMAWGSAIVRW
jgi:3-oxoacyl-[acyl-carrier-protein] synthase-3